MGFIICTYTWCVTNILFTKPLLPTLLPLYTYLLLDTWYIFAKIRNVFFFFFYYMNHKTQTHPVNTQYFSPYKVHSHRRLTHSRWTFLATKFTKFLRQVMVTIKPRLYVKVYISINKYTCICECININEKPTRLNNNNITIRGHTF